MEEVLRIATLNGAEAMGVDADLGSIAVGKRANLVLFDASPLARAPNLLAGKTVIKNGVVWQP